MLDVYPEVTPDEWLRIVGALIARYKRTVDAVVLRSQNGERQKMFCGKGFNLNTFQARRASGLIMELLPTSPQGQCR